jgi:hypothetical protein
MKAMKFIAVFAMLSLSMSAMCQTNVMDSKLHKKIEKDAKKEAKKMEKEGWKTTWMPLEKQLYRYYAYMYDSDENGSPNYIMGTGQSAMNNYDAARMQATELARSEIARNVDQMVIGFIENTIGDEHDAIITILTELHCSSLNSERMSIIAVVEAYRDLPDKNREVQMRLVLKEPVSKVMYKFKSALRDELRKRGLKLSEKTMKLLEKKSVENDINEISKKVSE